MLRLHTRSSHNLVSQSIIRPRQSRPAVLGLGQQSLRPCPAHNSVRRFVCNSSCNRSTSYAVLRRSRLSDVRLQDLEVSYLCLWLHWFWLLYECRSLSLFLGFRKLLGVSRSASVGSSWYRRRGRPHYSVQYVLGPSLSASGRRRIVETLNTPSGVPIRLSPERTTKPR